MKGDKHTKKDINRVPRTVAERERDLGLVADLYCRGVPVSRIRDAISAKYPEKGKDYITLQTVHNDLQRVRTRWQDAQVTSFSERQSLVLAKIDRLERQAWRGWENSLKNKVKNEKYNDGTNSSDRETIESQSGNPVFLTVIDSCIDRRCKLLGLYAPTKTALTDVSGNDAAPFRLIIPESWGNKVLPEIQVSESELSTSDNIDYVSSENSSKSNDNNTLQKRPDNGYQPWRNKPAEVPYNPAESPVMDTIKMAIYHLSGNNPENTGCVISPEYPEVPPVEIDHAKMQYLIDNPPDTPIVRVHHIEPGD